MPRGGTFRRRWPLSGIGYYSQDPLPVDPVPAGIAGLLAALKGPPGVRLAATNDPSNRYFGTNLIPPQNTIERIPYSVNRDLDLEQSILQAETYGPGIPIS